MTREDRIRARSKFVVVLLIADETTEKGLILFGRVMEGRRMRDSAFDECE